MHDVAFEFACTVTMRSSNGLDIRDSLSYLNNLLQYDIRGPLGIFLRVIISCVQLFVSI